MQSEHMLSGREQSTDNDRFIAGSNCPIKLLRNKDTYDIRQKDGDKWYFPLQPYKTIRKQGVLQAATRLPVLSAVI